MRLRRSKEFRKSYPLGGIGIDSFSEELEAKLIQLNIERQNRLRIRLSFEESLLRFWDKFGDGKEFEVSIVKSFGKTYVQVAISERVFNPLSKEENELNGWSSSLLMTAGLSQQFSYSKGVNILRIALPAQRMNPVLKIIFSILVGIAGGVILTSAMTDTTRIAELFFSPVFDAWIRILLAMAGPVIFFMVIATLLNMRSISEEGGNSKVVVFRFFAVSLIVGVIAAMIGQIAFMANFSNESLNSEKASELLDNLFNNIIPENIFSPLIDANTPQILVMAFVLGTLLIALGPKASSVTKLVKQCNIVGLTLAEWISRLVPYFAAVLICYQILTHQTVLLISVWQPLLFSLVASILFVLGWMTYVGIQKNVSIGLLIEKIWEPFLVTIKYGSLDASYGLAEQVCINGLGIEKHFTKVSLPHGLVMCMPINVMGTLIFTLFAAEHFNVTVTPLWFGIAIILAIVLFVATPPVPGANLLAYIAIFAQLGIASHALIDAMIFDIIFGIFASAANQTLLQMELVLQSDRIGLLNKAILQKR